MSIEISYMYKAFHDAILHKKVFFFVVEKVYFLIEENSKSDIETRRNTLKPLRKGNFRICTRLSS